MDKKLPVSLAIQFLKNNKAIAALLVGCGVVSNCLVIFLSLSIGTYYETLSHHHSSKDRILHWLHLSFPHKRHYFFILFFTLIIAASFFQFFFRYGSQRIALDFSFMLRKRLFRHHTRMKNEDFSRKTIGSYLLRYSGDLKNVQSYLEKGFFQFGSDILFIIIGIVLLFQLHFHASIYVAGGLTLGFLLMHYLSSKIKKLENNRTDMLSSSLSYIHESLHALETIKTWNKEFVTIKNFKKKTNRLYDISLRSSFYRSIHHVLPFSILFFTLLTVFLTHSIGSGEQGGSFIPYVLLLLLLFPSIKRSMRISSVWRSGALALEKIHNMLLFPLEADVLQNYEPAEGKIEFINVSFFYDENNKVLDNASFTWQPGDINYISGRGKTTLFKLLIGLYEPTGGKIFVDGSEIRNYSKKSLRNHIAFLSEGTRLHGNSIYKCLYLQNRIYSHEEVQACLRLLRFSTAGENIEVDLHKNIGRGGRQLSHSDLEKLKIARTLLSEKKILLIDGGITESLDEEIQREVIFFLEQMKDERTIIISGKGNPSIHKNYELAREWSLSNRFDTEL